MRPPKSSFSSTSGGPSSCVERALNAEKLDFALAVGALSASESPICSVARVLFATDWPTLSLIRFSHSAVSRSIVVDEPVILVVAFGFLPFIFWRHGNWFVDANVTIG